MILTPAQRRGLNFVWTANAGGYRPTGKEVTEWVFRPERIAGARGPLLTPAVKGALGLLMSSYQTPPIMKSLMGSPAVYGPSEPGENYVAHLLRLGWLRLDETKGLLVTALGKALLREQDLEEDDGGPNARTIVLEAGSSLAYPMLLRHIVESGDAFIVDPYLRMEQLHELLTLTSVERVLTGPNLRAGEVAAIRTLLGAGGRAIEVRQAGIGVLHDRYVIGDLGVHQVGSSLGNVGKGATTLLLPLPDHASEYVADLAEGWWKAANPLIALPAPS